MLTISLDGEIYNVELIFNELSIQGQFYDSVSFRNAIDNVMSIRQMARRYDRELQCHRNVSNRPVKGTQILPQCIGSLDKDSQRVLMQWLTRHGPFWEDFQQHAADDWLEYEGCIVTDTAVGEAAYCVAHGVERALVSIDPSSWLTSPLPVDWRYNSSVKRINVSNYWSVNELEKFLANAPSSLLSWEDLATTARNRYPELIFAPDCFEPLKGHPFNKGSADRMLLRIGVLNSMKNSFDQQGKRTSEGHTLYQKYFTGEKAWFSDSSDREKDRFAKELTFPHPADPDKTIFATWHGKVKTPQLRIHFSWPIRADKPLYIVYAGPKITKR